MRLALAATVLLILTPALGHAACSASASGVAFGTYLPFSSTPAGAVGTVSVTCTAVSGVTDFTVALNAGGGASIAARRMTSGGTNLSYQLYTDAAHTQIWGDGTGGSVVVTCGNCLLNGGTFNYSVYGLIPARQVASPGSYTEPAITVTVAY